MKKIQYQILRFLPDRVSGEFVNLGVVAMDIESKSLAYQFIQKVGHLPGMFPSANSRHLLRSVKYIQQSLQSMNKGFFMSLLHSESDNIEAITASVLPKDDSALVFTEVKLALDINVKAAVNHFFSRMVRVDDLAEDEEVRSDKEVWNKIYKKHFEKKGIAKHLSSHKVKTNDDVLEFDRAWKNGHWNCFETVSFNLNHIDTIKNKVYKWVGKLDELNVAKEPLHIYLLSVMPNDHPELELFINKKLQGKSTKHTHVEIVKEENVDAFTDKIKLQMDKHYQDL